MTNQIYGMRRLFDSEKFLYFLYGGDVPFTPFAAASMLGEVISQSLSGLFNLTEINMILHGNAEKLLDL